MEQARIQIMNYISFYNEERFQDKLSDFPRLNSGKKSPFNRTLFYSLLNRAMTN
ncbi:hypothetical protein [Paenibacillus amylolyticus]|uniref:hypothetical protein n=1 Tax=Paenibacillus amylolyticus TaxID=1451 RepID=UPI00338D6B0C